MNTKYEGSKQAWTSTHLQISEKNTRLFLNLREPPVPGYGPILDLSEQSGQLFAVRAESEKGKVVVYLLTENGWFPVERYSKH